MASLHHISFAVSLTGVAVILWGVGAGLIQLLRVEIASARGDEASAGRRQLRHALGYHLLLGLEFLIAADIVQTLMTPTLQDLGILGSIVLIRTVISFSLNAELRTDQKDERATMH